jgi:hypothetical protein
MGESSGGIYNVLRSYRRRRRVSLSLESWDWLRNSLCFLEGKVRVAHLVAPLGNQEAPSYGHRGLGLTCST